MGTRNITAVFIDGEYKIAQYGQWDGYPEGQGKDALNYLRGTVMRSALDTDEFKRKVRAARWMENPDGKLIKDYPQCSRDNGANTEKAMKATIHRFQCDLCETYKDQDADITPPGWKRINAPRPGNIDEYVDRFVFVCAGCIKKLSEFVP